jgi:hypothetical protein
LLKRLNERDLADIFYEYGEERFASRIARSVIARRRTTPITTSTGLLDTIRQSLPPNLRWRAERWMKARHVPAVAAHAPGFVAKHGLRMMRHTFRGTTLKTWIGLESERDAFRRYREIRRAEREFFKPPLAPEASYRTEASRRVTERSG